MDCNIIKDLIPLCIDECCSPETSAQVKKHISECENCKAVFDSMSSEPTYEVNVYESTKHSRINDWKASVLQSVLFLISFLAITLGVAIEAGTPLGITNSIIAFNAVVPVTAFMLSLVNWYFVKLYKSRKIFSWCSCIMTFVITVGASLWTAWHYDINIFEIFTDATLTDIAEHISFFYSFGIVLAVILVILSKVLSDIYAKMLGKE